MGALAEGRDPESTRAGDIATTRLVSCDAHATIADVANKMMEEYVRHVLIENRGRFVGIVSARDVLARVRLGRGRHELILWSQRTAGLGMPAGIPGSIEADEQRPGTARASERNYHRTQVPDYAGPRSLRQLLDAVVTVGSDLDLPAMLRRIVEAAVSLVDAHYGALGVLDERGPAWRSSSPWASTTRPTAPSATCLRVTASSDC